jgi:hypothetical protein
MLDLAMAGLNPRGLIRALDGYLFCRPKEAWMDYLKLTSRKTITAALIIASLLVHTSVWALNKLGTPAAQGNKRVVEKVGVLKNEPIEVTAIKIKGKAVMPGEMFEEGEEWLKGLNFTVRNKSDKVITYIVLNVDFPETKETGSMMMHSLYLGQQPDAKSTLANPPLRLEPNESIDVSLASQYEAIRDLIGSRQPPTGNIHIIKVWLDQAMFEDGTLYSGGNIYKRNPDTNSPRKWVLVANEQADP